MRLTQDLIYALGKVVTDVPAALSRRVDPRAGVALVWGTVHSGAAENVIPSTGTVSGTLRMLGPQAPRPTAQSLGGEDLAWYVQAVPGAMARLGTRTPGGRTCDLHQGDLVVDERAVAIGARLLAGAATAVRPSPTS